MIYCCGCQKEVKARLTDGAEIYPHREDLYSLAMWICDTCDNYVGCHPGTGKALGSIPTPEIRKARQKIHAALDPMWRFGRYTRGDLYKKLSNRLGYNFHSAEINSLEQAEIVYQKVLEL